MLMRTTALMLSFVVRNIAMLANFATVKMRCTFRFLKKALTTGRMNMMRM
jgi:hypothetical protein